jgi:hypothetical protein
MAKFKKSALGSIAKMICGDHPFNDSFPYRSSSYLTRFFHDLDLDFTHDGSTRYWWVLQVLEQLNDKASASPELPSEEMIKVVESLIHPDYFSQGVGNKTLALEKLNELLRSYEVEIGLGKTGVPHLVSTTEHFVSTAANKKEVKKVFTFSPSVFNYPSVEQEKSLVAVMMPFSTEFSPIYDAIKEACKNNKLLCHRADGLWSNSTIIQDIFDLIYASKIVVVDFSSRNPNVMYETGIAHTLGKIVVPITQSLEDIPFDLKPHRALKYLSNKEGLADLSRSLEKRFQTIINGHSWTEPVKNIDEIPF